MQTILLTKTKTNIIHTEELRKQFASYLHIAYSTANTGNHMKGINHAITKKLSSINPVSNCVQQILSNCPNKQSDSDPIPTWLLKECSSVLVIGDIVNLSLISGQFHPTLKESVISPLLKKPTSD